MGGALECCAPDGSSWRASLGGVAGGSVENVRMRRVRRPRWVEPPSSVALKMTFQRRQSWVAPSPGT